jgi:hypothetical protein
MAVNSLSSPIFRRTTDNASIPSKLPESKAEVQGRMDGGVDLAYWKSLLSQRFFGRTFGEDLVAEAERKPFWVVIPEVVGSVNQILAREKKPLLATTSCGIAEQFGIRPEEVKRETFFQMLELRTSVSKSVISAIVPAMVPKTPKAVEKKEAKPRRKAVRVSLKEDVYDSAAIEAECAALRAALKAPAPTVSISKVSADIDDWKSLLDRRFPYEKKNPTFREMLLSAAKSEDFWKTLKGMITYVNGFLIKEKKFPLANSPKGIAWQFGLETIGIGSFFRKLGFSDKEIPSILGR